MKILLYNFALPGDGNPSAGGVGVYLGALAKGLRTRGANVILLTSGHDYSPWSTKPKIAFSLKNQFNIAKIINSPVIAPGHDNFFSPDEYIYNTSLNTFPSVLKKRYGNIDVLHFQNIEGLTNGFFREARRTFPNAQIILSAHNYHLVCPQVNLWKSDRAACTDYEAGHACVSCIPFRTADFKKRVRAAWWLKAKTAYLPVSLVARMLQRRGLPVGEKIHLPLEITPGMPILATSELAASFRSFRATNIDLASTIFDHVLAVSERTRSVLMRHGMESHNLATSYIGSAHVKTSDCTKRRCKIGEVLHIAYFGYARRDKGFGFFMNAMEALPASMAKRIKVTIAAKIGDTRIIGRVGKLGRKLSSVSLRNGYDSKELSALLEQVDLGIVPPIWEDNLPQVAIEFVANGVPILTSNAGGASEIGRNPNFTFSASSIPAFTEALRRILDREVPIGDFWIKEPNIRTFDAHLDELMPLYEQSARALARSTTEASPYCPNS